MIQINRNNYEEYLVDFLDGTLSDSDYQRVVLFLENNPDIKEELKGMEEVRVNNSDHILFQNKLSLKKTVVLDGMNATFFDETCIADMEGDLDVREQESLVKLLNADNAKRREYELYKQTKLTPDKQIFYLDKDHLKRKKTQFFSSPGFLTGFSAAASVLILLAMYIFWPYDKNLISSNNIVSESTYESVDKDKIPGDIVAKNDITIKKMKTIKPITTKYNDLNSKVKLEKNSFISDPEIKKKIIEDKPIQKLNPQEPSYQFNYTTDKNYLAEVSLKKYLVEEVGENSQNFREFIASFVTEKVFNKERKENFELFHVAQAGVKGINKLVGGSMSLERTFDEKGVPQTTEFTSSLVAFSAPVKKKSE